jgi:hypothetical protein
MAVLFEAVYLFGVPTRLDISTLEDEGLVGMGFTTGECIGYETFGKIPAVFIRAVKPLLVRDVQRMANRML